MKKDLLLIIALYLLGCLAVLPYVKWYVDNPDSLQYVSIAHHILEGKFSLAINGYWSPLISWLLMPFIYVFGDGVIAFKYLQMAVGVYVIIKWIALLSLAEIEHKSKRILGFGIIPFVISYSLNNLTPDLLFVGILMSLIAELIKWLDKKSSGEKIGRRGGLLFLTKAFGLPLFIFLFCVCYWMKDERLPKQTLKKILFPFILICSVWIVCLSVKYKRVTISESAKFNFTYEVAPVEKEIVLLPVINSGLLKPANGSALSAWEEPSSQIKLTPIDPVNDIKYYGKLVKRNLLSIYYHDFSRQLGIIFFLLLIIFLIRKKEKQTPLWVKIFLLVIFAVYSGYSLILVHERYVWICSLLFLPMIFFFAQEIFSNGRLKMSYEIGIILIMLFAIKRPAKEVLMCGDRDVTALQLYHAFRSPGSTLEIFYRKDIQLHNDIEKLKKVIPENSDIASIVDPDRERDGYASSQLVAYECKSRYFGQTVQRDTSFKGYVISWSDEEGEKVFGSESGLKIYRR